MILAVACIFVDAKASFTVATFADPAKSDSNYPLFDVNFISMKLDGGWSDEKTGLTLEIPYNGNIFYNAWFDVNGVVTLSNPPMPGMPYGTGPGQINFYANGNSTNPLLVIEFNGAALTLGNFGANELYAENVTIKGSQITGQLSEEMFSFTFGTNPAHLPGSTNFDDGFVTTASFTSSAVPEPATIGLLCLGALSLVRRKKCL
jgi:hypothetical protein